jgi:adenylate cyclase class IV
MPRTIEVELRGLLASDEHDRLIERLTREGADFEVDDKDTYFFNFPAGILKVCDESSKDSGKISLKLGDEAHGALDETEIQISREDAPRAIHLLSKLGYGDPHHVPQKRTNYFLGSATLSVKYTPEFGHHFELEGDLLDSEARIELEKQRLQEICHAYGLVPLEPGVLEARIKDIRKRIGFA